MWRDIGAALCLVLVIEGMLPFLSPVTWRGMMTRVLQADDAALRMAGFGSMLLGIVLLQLIR